MPKPRTCQHCKARLPYSGGFLFDKDLNLICKACGKVVFSTKEESTVTTTTTTVAETHQAYNDGRIRGMGTWMGRGGFHGHD